jgi:membrane protease subunit HflK
MAEQDNHTHPHEPHGHHHGRKLDSVPANEPNAPEAVDASSQALSEALRSSFTVVKVVMVVLLFVFLGSGFFTVGPQERAIILRLGKPVGEGESALLGPGLHWSFPYPIDEYVKVSITGIQRATSKVGWYATTPEQELAGTEPPPGGTLNPAVDGYALTADGNIVHTRATINYRISDPVRYVFGLVNASNAVQTAIDNAILYAASRSRIDDILTRDVAGFNELVRRGATELAERQNLGIVIEECVVQSRPPRQLKDAFDSVLRAEVNRSKVLNEARSYEHQVTSRASADAEGRKNAAESERARLVAETSSRGEQFSELLPQYRSNPQLFVQQRLTETLGRVFTNAQDKIFVAEGAAGKTRELRLLLNREPPKPKGPEQRP